MGGRVSSPVFVGRLEELERLEAAWTRAMNGEPAVVLLGGEAGVGKTRSSLSWPPTVQPTALG